MSEPTDPTDARRRANRLLNEDGLVDLALGIGLLFAALYAGLDRAAHVRLAVLAGLVPVLIVLLIGALRRRVIHPRIGRTKLPAIGAVPGLSIILALLFFVGLAALLVHELSSPRPSPESLMWLLRGLMLAGGVVLGLIGLRTGLKRFYVNAAVMVLSALVAGLIFTRARVAVVVMNGVPGVTLLASGIVALTRFLHKYPLPSQPEGESEQSHSH